jgi:2-polyprenyl-3-methyl-5-hydroxy-6-metoxy-1,4-benzoquinol methylase
MTVRLRGAGAGSTAHQCTPQARHERMLGAMKLETENDAGLWYVGAQALAVVSAWTELGLFEKLRAGALAPSDLEVDRRALAITLPILLHLGVLSSDGERIALTPTTQRLMDAGGLPTSRNLEHFADLSRLAEVMREGGPVRDQSGRPKATRGGTQPGDMAQTERFLDYLYRRSEEASRETFAWLSPELPAKGTVLDLGGGHGRYARAFADGGFATTLFDQPEVIDLARKRHGGALSYLPGDFHTIESFGGPYDLILLCNIVHGESAETNASIIARAAKSLAPGGRIALRDMFIDEHGQNPRSAVFFGMTMLFYTDHGTSPSVDQARAWLAAAGLGSIKMTSLETHQIITAGRSR